VSVNKAKSRDAIFIGYADTKMTLCSLSFWAWAWMSISKTVATGRRSCGQC
jgi:hypothetical protein